MMNVAIVAAAQSVYRTKPIDNLLMEWAGKNNLPITDNAVVAYTNGMNIGFSVSAGSGRNGGYMAAVPVVASTWNKQVQKTLKKELKGVGMLVYEKKTSNLYVIMSGSRFSKEKLFSRFDTAAYTLSTRLPQLGVYLVPTCRYCNNVGSDSFVVEEGVCHTAHTACKEAHIQQILSEVAENEMNGNYLLGILGAVLGGIVGTIPSLVIAFFFDMISALLFMLIPMAAAYGYRLAKGVQNKVMILVVVLTSLACSVGLVFSLLYIYDLLYYGMFLTWEEFIVETFTVDLEAFVELAFKALAFTALGIVFAWGSINKTNKARLAKVQAIQAQHAQQVQMAQQAQVVQQAPPSQDS